MSGDQEQFCKTCPMCEKIWRSRNEFLADPELEFIGYQANLGLPEEGLFYFTHETAACGSTMAIKVASFLSLYAGRRYSDIKMYSKGCRGYCLQRDQLHRCEEHCRYAYVREVAQIIKSWRKESAGCPVRRD